MAAKRSDVSAIIEAFTHEELAVFMARTVHNHKNSVHVFRSVLATEGGDGAPLIAKVKDEGRFVVVDVHEPQRTSGYYLVYDANYCRDVVLWWSSSEGHWFDSHLEGALAQDQIFQVRRIIIDKHTLEAANGS